mmetsp:Transcript_2976/g.4289  ORF Transcript_2976/g.4289 Transcript_2976/m.4289 type:complete len:502 (+) Transcript_2976:16-1521(+)
MTSLALVALAGCYYAFATVDAFTPAFSTGNGRILSARSSSASYLESLTHTVPPENKAMMGATAKYLDALSNHLDSTVGDARFDPSFLSQATNELANSLLDAIDSSSQTLAPSLLELDAADRSMELALGNPTTVSPDHLEYSFQGLSKKINEWTLQFTESVQLKNEVPSVADNSQSSPLSSLNDMASQFQKSLSNLKASNIEKTLSSLEEGAEKSKPATMNAVSSTLEHTFSSTRDVMDKVTAVLPNSFEQIGATLSSKTNTAISSMDRTVAITASKLSLLTSPLLFPTAAAATTANDATSAAVSGRISAATLAAQHGWSEDLNGVIQIIVATLLSVPRAVVEGVTDQPIDILLSDLHQALIAPLSAPLQGMEAMTPLEQATAVLTVLQLLLAIVVAVPLALVEGLSGMTLEEIQTNVSQWEISQVTGHFVEFAETALMAVVSVLRIVTGAFGPAPEEMLMATSTFLVQDLLPAIVDGFILLIQQVLVLLLGGGAALMSAVG